MMKRKKLWFSPKTHSGWKKTQSATNRRQKLLTSVSKRLSLAKRYVTAGRKAQSLSNVTKDATTKRLAKQDAMYFFKKAKQKKK